MHFCFIINVNKIIDLDIDFRFYYGLQGLSSKENARVSRNLLPIAQQWGKLVENSLNQFNFS